MSGRLLPPRRKQDSTANLCTPGVFLVVGLFIAALVALIVVFATYPYPATSSFRDSNLKGYGKDDPRRDCTVGEIYDSDLSICAPIMHTPVPISPELMDPDTRFCDDFFRATNGKWIDTHKNENRGFSYVHKRNMKVIHDIVTSPSSGPVYTFYRSCLDTVVHGYHQLLDKVQLQHVKEHILGALKTHADLPIVFARLSMYGFSAPFSFTIEPHPTELRMIPMIQYQDLAGFDLGTATIDQTMLKTCYNKLQHWRTDSTVAPENYLDYIRSDRYLSDLKAMTHLIDLSPTDFWKLYLRELNGYRMEEDVDRARNGTMVWIPDYQYIMSLMHGLAEISLPEWIDYVTFSIEYHSQQYVPDLPPDNYFRIRNPFSSKARVKRERRHQIDCIEATHQLLPAAVGNAFLHKQPAFTKHRIQSCVEHVREALADMVRATRWLGTKSKEQLVNKIRAIIVRTVHPNYFETEPFLQRLTMDNYLRNLNLIRRYAVSRNFELWTDGEPNRDFIQRFGASLAEVNAFYSPVTNTITIFSGILNPPFYNETFPNVALYAIIGMIAGHELAHAVDRSGRWFDRDGSVYRTEQWTTNEVEAYDNATETLMNEYQAPNGCPNAQYGEQTINEDMSDVIGLTAAMNAFLRYGGGKESDLPSFFQIFSQAWSETWETEKLCDRVNNDVHAIATYRVDVTLRQMPAFAKAFNCREGDLMVNPKPVVIFG